jgi:hypothetical protein
VEYIYNNVRFLYVCDIEIVCSSLFSESDPEILTGWGVVVVFHLGEKKNGGGSPLGEKNSTLDTL